MTKSVFFERYEIPFFLIMSPIRTKRNNNLSIIYNIQKTIGLPDIASYFHYEKHDTKCLVALGYLRCSKYIEASSHMKYDVYSPSKAKWQRVESEDESLQKE